MTRLARRRVAWRIDLVPDSGRNPFKETIAAHLDLAIAVWLRGLCRERGWTLDDVAQRSGVSRATLSRLANGEPSPTTAVPGRLCAADGVTLSHLIRLVEEAFAPLVPRDAQPVWSDPGLGIIRRSVSPPARDLTGEALERSLAPGSRIGYDAPPRLGLEQHLVLLDGALTITVDGVSHALGAGDCLRYRLDGASAFAAHAGARYLMFLV